MKHLTIRDISPALANALEKEARDSNKSLNQTVKDLLERALGVSADGVYDNGLGRFAGSWSEEEFQAFQRATAVFERMGEDLWK